MIYVGIDNGVSGSIGWKSQNTFGHVKTPVFRCLDYPKRGKYINRIDTAKLHQFLYEICLDIVPEEKSLVLLERPMVNPKRFYSTGSALRSMEATLITLEELKLAYRFVDSKEWQKVLLPRIKGSKQLKEASLQIGKQLFPSLQDQFRGDADGILIAEWGYREKL